jgi:superfamily II DNA or RNA helicase
MNAPVRQAELFDSVDDVAAPKLELRDYQQKAIDDFEADQHRSVLLVSPTGSGKTVIATSIMKRHASLWKSSLFIVHRREIVRQTSAKLRELKVPHGVIMAGEKPRLLERVQVAAIQTLHARAVRTDRMPMPEADLVVIDEAHHAPAEMYQQVLAAYPNARIIGLTATPCRGDGRGLGDIFQAMIELPQVPELVEKGHLVATRVYAPSIPDLEGLKVRMGDYVEAQLADRMDTDRLVGDLVYHWLKYGERRKTVVFATGVGHSVHIRDEFCRSGVRAEHIDATTPKAERDEILDRLRRNEIEVVVNCAVLTEGWDMPEIGCCILARPTRQIGLYRQMLGRVLRPAPGKTDAIVLDHAGAVHRHGFAEDRIEWTLDPDRDATNRTHAKREATGKDRFVECSQCGVMREGGKACPHCGFIPPPKPVEFQPAAGELGLVDRDRQVKAPVYDHEARTNWHAMLLHIADQRGYKPGWAAHKYKEKFDDWPPRFLPQPIDPAPEVLSWVRSRAIAYAKSRGTAA